MDHSCIVCNHLIIFKSKFEEFFPFLQRKRVEEEKEEESPKVSKTYEGGNTGAKEVEEEKEEMKGDKEENVLGGRKVTISFLYIFTNCFM